MCTVIINRIAPLLLYNLRLCFGRGQYHTLVFVARMKKASYRISKWWRYALSIE
jgi:hypothetical protein